MQAHQRGDLTAAEAGYRGLLTQDPNHPDATHMLGVLLHQRGEHAQAEQLIRRAIMLSDQIADYHCHHGVVLRALSRTADALYAYDKALQLAPEYAHAHNNRGNVLRDLGHLDEALHAYDQALLFKPDYVDAANNRIKALQALGRADEALRACDEALRLNPGFAEAHQARGNVLLDLGRPAEALHAFEQALQLRPDYVESHNNRGAALRCLGREEEALRAFDTVLRLKPDYADAQNNRGNVLNALGRMEEALRAYDRALQLSPDRAEMHNNRGVALSHLGRFEDALLAYQEALRLQPDYAEAHNNRAHALNNIGCLDDALLACDAALRLKPDYPEVCSNRLFILHYHEELHARERCMEALGAVGSQWVRRLPPFVPRLQSVNGRRLRVGYVSGDFRRHSVGFFLQGLLAQHERTRVEVWAYMTSGREDATTGLLKSQVDHWQPVVGVSDEEAAARIRSDQIDVLIDLSGHTEHNRLGVFVQRAAPVQAHYLGFMGSTGVPEMDYWIGDPVLTPERLAAEYSETLWPLPRVWVAYGADPAAPAPVWQSRRNGYITLGSFNNLMKLTPRTITLWARVLHAMPQARLLLKTRELGTPSNRARVLDAFGQRGISAERLELQDRQSTPSWAAHMAFYSRLDIALDPIGPVCGGTTTCDALWMGVPLVSRLGDRMGSRMSASMLTAIGREEWIAKDDEEYIAKVIELARDVEGRREIRLTQREQMRASPLCDAKGLASALEDAYEAMYERWWAEQGGKAVTA